MLLNLQRKVGNRAMGRLIQRSKVGPQGGEAGPAVQQELQHQHGTGQSLPGGVSRQMGRALGADLSSVRVHTNPQADTLNRSLGAQAFTFGSDVYFSNRSYDPYSTVGKKLIAHELTHVVQQGGAKSNAIQTKLKVGAAGDSYEQEADRVAESVMRTTEPPAPRPDEDEARGGMAVQRSTAPQQVQRFVPKFEKTLITDNKSTKILGWEGKRSLTSRVESEHILDMTAAERVDQLKKALTTGIYNRLDAFKRAALLLVGRSSDKLGAEFQKQTGFGLRYAIYTAFPAKPQTYSADYLLSIIENGGEAPLKSMIMMTLGQVDSPRSDDQRLLQLYEKNPPEFTRLWPSISALVRKRVERQATYTRLAASVETQKATDKLATSTTVPTDSAALAVSRDKQLAAMVRHRIEKYYKVLELASRVALQGVTLNTVKHKDLTEDIIKWRQTARTQDVAEVRKTTSEFRRAITQIPKYSLQTSPRGVLPHERQYFVDLATNAATAGTGPTGMSDSVKGMAMQASIERNKTKVSAVTGKIREKLSGIKWDKLSDEIRKSTPEEREALLNRYPGTTRTDKLTAFENELRTMLTGKQLKEADFFIIMAAVRGRYEGSGDSHAKLWDLVGLKTGFDKVKAKKKSKWGETALKIIAKMTPPEFAQVRQDTELLTRLEAGIMSGKKEHWEPVKKMLGITGPVTTPIDPTLSDEAIIDQARSVQLTPDYWATQLKYMGMKSSLVKGTTETKGKKVSAMKVGWIVYKAKAAAREYEKESTTGETASDFMQKIYALLSAQEKQLLDEAVTKEDQKEAKKETKGKEAHRILGETKGSLTGATKVDPNDPTATLDVQVGGNTLVAKSLDKAKKRFLRPDRAILAQSILEMEPRDLLEQWSNLSEYKGLYKTFEDTQGRHEHAMREQRRVAIQVVRERDGFKQQKLKDRHEEMGTAARSEEALGRQLQRQLGLFVLGISKQKHGELLKTKGGGAFGSLKGKFGSLTSADRIQMEQMISERLIEVAESDPDARQILDAAKMPYGEWMAARMRAIGSLESQRQIDHTRQWHYFSNKSSLLDEGTRSVIGAVRSGNVDIRDAEEQMKSPEELQAIKSQHSEKTENAVMERSQLEAAFRDMQAKFNARAELLMKLITTGIITALTMGMGGPIAIGVHAAMLLGQTVIHALFRHFVLKQPASQVVAQACFDILNMSIQLITANLTFALNESVLHPTTFAAGAEYLAPGMATAIGKSIYGLTMAYPQTVVKHLYNQKPFDEVVAKGKEASFTKDFLKGAAKGMLKPFVKYVVKDMAIGSVQEYAITPGTNEVNQGMYNASGGMMGATKPPPMTTEERWGVQDTRPLDQVYAEQFGQTEGMEYLEKMQQKQIKKDIKKDLGNKNGNTLLDSTGQQDKLKDKQRDQMMRIRNAGVELVEENGTVTTIKGNHTLGPGVLVYFSGGHWWMSVQAPTVGTAPVVEVNDKSVLGAGRLHAKDKVKIDNTVYTVRLGK
jgi:Domain of unknown function (DUF4157)